MNLRCDFADLRGQGVRCLVVAVLLVLAWPGRALAQSCGPRWLDGDVLAGADRLVRATAVWDPDGPGPASPLLVVGGEFTSVRSLRTKYLAAYDLATHEWATLGGVFSGPVFALAVLPDNTLVAAGSFWTVGAAACKGVARWNGSAWAPMGVGMGDTDFTVNALAVLPDGKLVAGGEFRAAGGVLASHVAQWDGSAWSPLGAGVNNSVYALTALPNGNVVAGGRFSQAGTTPAANIARWDGTAWSAMDAGVSQAVNSLTSTLEGDVIAGGRFFSASSVAANNIARWSFATGHWSALGAGSDSAVSAITRLSSGAIVASGSSVSVWNGSSWTSIGALSGALDQTSATGTTITELPGGDLLVGGGFFRANSTAASGLARWNGSAWSALTPGSNGYVNALAATREGGMLAAGDFDSIGQVAARNVARWDGVEWSPLGGGTDLAARAILELPNGDVVAGGSFTSAGGVPGTRAVARWDGAQWHSFGPGLLSGNVRAMAIMPSGELVVGGDQLRIDGVNVNALLRWNGVAWSAFSPSLSGGGVNSLVVRPDDQLVAAGTLSIVGNPALQAIATWTGADWSGVGVGFRFQDIVYSLANLSNGDLVAAGQFSLSSAFHGNAIARWDGSAWTPLAAGMDEGYSSSSVRAVVALPDNNLVAAGLFATADGVSTRNIARWDGSTWSALGSGTDNVVSTVVRLASGEVVAGGAFTIAGGHASAGIARWTETGVPWIARNPRPGAVECGQTLVLSAAAATGYGVVDVRWQLEDPSATGSWIDLADGPLTIANQPVGNLTGTQSNDLRFTPSASAGPVRFRAVAANACGSSPSTPALVTISCPAPCDPDLNHDGNADQEDLATLVNIIAGGPNPDNTNPDFNHDGNTDQVDIADLVNVLAGGNCP